MKTNLYHVRLDAAVHYVVSVEAESERQACDAVSAMLNTDEGLQSILAGECVFDTDPRISSVNFVSELDIPDVQE